MKALPIGISDFKKMIDKDYFYVDKTLLIKELLDNKGDVNLFTRPRRFGKTLNMSMLKYFFSNTEQNNKYIFDNMAISKCGDEYLQYMNEYPVISLTLKSAKQPNYQIAYDCLKDVIANEFKRYKHILDNISMDKDDKNKFLLLSNREASTSEYATSIQFLSKCLENHYNKKVIILIDEYDVPLENSYFAGFYNDMIDFIRSLFESALKDNNSLEFSVITGCLRISKESIFTGLNHLEIISILNNYYSEYFGFTNDEVRDILKFYKLESKKDIIKDWYNGYLFGKTEVYNPWSLIRYVKDLVKDENTFPVSYWGNTSSNTIIRQFIERADMATKTEIDNLMAGGTIEKPIHVDITYDDIYDNMNNFWNFLFFTGYLKKVSERFGQDKIIYLTLTIPNEEIAYVYKDKISQWFLDVIKGQDFNKMYNSIFEVNTNILEEELSDILMNTISYQDYGENFYHGFLAGVLSKLNGYMTKSNLESGLGRSDIILKPYHIRKPAIIFELKIVDKLADLDKKCNEALLQIKTMNYENNLIQEGYKSVIKYGIAFYKKQCMVKSYTENDI